MFTENQTALLRVLAEQPDQVFTMSQLGRMLGKAPGVFQRGLNALEAAGYIVSRREANLRLLRFNVDHPQHEAITSMVSAGPSPLPSDVYLAYGSSGGSDRFVVAEPPGLYASSALKMLIIAGPNGAGKTTFAREFLPAEAGCPLFINADFIAHALSPFAPEAAALKAGKVMLGELHDHIAHRRNLAFETTLSGRRYAEWIPRWQERGYAVKLVFLSLPSVELALARVAGRVRQGGHSIPEETIRRRFEAGLRNYAQLYRPLVDAWALFDNAGTQPVLLEDGER